MPGQPAAPGEVITDRRERYRAFLKRFNPTAPPVAAFQEELVVEDPARPHKRLAVGADLDPGSQRLLAGGIGSGKSTELLLTRKLLRATGKTLALYIDITAETDLSVVNSGALLASLGLHLLKRLKDRERLRVNPLSSVAERVREFAYGKKILVSPEDEYLNIGDEAEVIEVPGKLRPLFPALRRDIGDFLEPLGVLLDDTRKTHRDVVAIFDGLDRLMTVEKLLPLVTQDMPAIRKLGISVIAAAPLSVRYGEGRQIADYFEAIEDLPCVVPDLKESPFLVELLDRRGATDLLDSKGMTRLCNASGGVLRDLISLVRNAASDAYLDAADTIETKHIESAVLRFGQGYYLGLGRTGLEELRRLRHGGGFSPQDDLHVELLLTRRVLEYPPDRYEVHPALAPLL